MSAELSTIGITFGYAVETVAGTRPTAFTELNNITNIGGVPLNAEHLEVTNLIDTVHRFIEGLKANPESTSVTVNMNKACLTAWTAARTAAVEAWADGKQCWWQVHVPNMGDFYYAGIPAEVGINDIGVNEVFAVDVEIGITDIAGWVAS